METPENKEQLQEVVTPPPFCPSDEPEATPDGDASPTLAERIAHLALDENAAARLTALTAGIDGDHISPELLDTLAHGVTHDNDVQNADAAGYLRGRNEHIEAVLHPAPDEEEPATAPVFPRYCRRSIWD